MPAYQYECQYCRKEWTEHLNYNESPIMCPFCEQKEFKKVYNYVVGIDKSLNKSEQKVGSKTRKFIEESRKELEEQKETMRGK